MEHVVGVLKINMLENVFIYRVITKDIQGRRIGDVYDLLDEIISNSITSDVYIFVVCSNVNKNIFTWVKVSQIR